MTDSTATYARHLPDEDATAALGRELAMILAPGDLVCLEGDLGSGKSSLARAIVRALTGRPDLDVPSPTFAIAQLYEDGPTPVAHFDFYRVGSPAEAGEVGLDEALGRAVVLVEWPGRAGALTAHRLTVGLAIEGSGRRATLEATGPLALRLERLLERRRFIEEHGWAKAHRAAIPGDASTRRYERLSLEGRPAALLMDMPAQADGPPVRDGLPYSRIAHLAETAASVVAVNSELKKRGYSAPEVFAFDIARGFVLIEDFGTQSFNAMIRAGADLAEPFATAVELLAGMAMQSWPERAPVPGQPGHLVAPYDIGALLIEAELFTDWFAPAFGGALPEGAREQYRAAWTDVLRSAARPARPVWVLRDFHVDNLFWLPDRQGVARVGLIDTQDCVLGHPAYDLVSMLQDARVDIAQATASDYLDLYCELRRTGDATFDAADFRATYAVLGAQRAAKILGIFTRLSRRDGKHGYLRHLPRVARLFQSNLAHPALMPVRSWFDATLPAAAIVAAAERQA
jgi:tRNA threonylcarbamoyl adenosine modification protein YjeE